MRPSSFATHPPLDYLQVSPVRGQLEPLDELTKNSGWRFLQCTDTPNELKVLLPPRTAQIYSLLLKTELTELAKQRDASWERILDIRHLKDRMIRKCHRLSKAYSSSNSGTRIPFLTLHAPPDFRLKEMEKWIKRQEGSDTLKKMVSSDTLRQRGSFCCDRCANLVPHHHTVSSRRSAVQPHSTHVRRSSSAERVSLKSSSSLSRRPSASAHSIGGISNSTPLSTKPVTINEDTTLALRSQETRLEEHTILQVLSRHQESVSSHVSKAVQEHAQAITSTHQTSSSLEASNQFASETQLQETKCSMHTIPEEPPERSVVDDLSDLESLGRLSIISPDPIPVPYQGSTSVAFMEICDSPIDVTRHQAATREKPRPRNSSAEDSTPSPPSENEPATDGAPRRRSSLKRTNSDLRISLAYSAKTVSWAMDRDWAHQMNNYHAAAAQVENADTEWGEICQKYEEELAGLKAIRRSVTQTLSKLRLETEKLQREDEVIRDQEEKLRQGFEQLGEKHDQYRAKVKAVLHETEQVLALCGTKRDKH